MFWFWPGHKWLGLAIDSLNFDGKKEQKWQIVAWSSSSLPKNHVLLWFFKTGSKCLSIISLTYFLKGLVPFYVTNSSLTVKCQCYPHGSNKSILIPPSVKKYVIFTINSLVRFAHSFVYLVKMTYFFPSVGIKKLLFSPLG